MEREFEALPAGTLGKGAWVTEGEDGRKVRAAEQNAARMVFASKSSRAADFDGEKFVKALEELGVWRGDLGRASKSKLRAFLEGGCYVQMRGKEAECVRAPDRRAAGGRPRHKADFN